MVYVDLKLHIFLSELLGLLEFILNVGVCGSNFRERGVTQSVPNWQDKVKAASHSD